MPTVEDVAGAVIIAAGLFLLMSIPRTLTDLLFSF